MSRGWATVAGVAVLATAACSQGQRTGDKLTRDALTSALGSAASTRAELDLAEVVTGGWTRVLFLCPYGNEDDVNKRLGFTWHEYPGPDDSEGLVTFVFASESEIVTWATLGRNLGDPCSGATPLGQSEKTRAKFRVEQTSTTAGGTPFHSLLQPRAKS